MTRTLHVRLLTALLAIAGCLAGARPSRAQATQDEAGASCLAATADACAGQSASRRPSLFKPFRDVVGDIRRVPSRDNLDWLVVGVGAAVGAHAMDIGITRNWSQAKTEPFRPGAFVGATPVELGISFATYAVARAKNNARAMNLGADLIRAQLLAELMTTGMKQVIRRARPEGSGFSFPSGHTTVTFASATVLHRHFGWKVGIPAYAVASYVAASRVQMKRHYLSDVAFGAALGVVVGRTVTIGRGHRLSMAPLATPDGGGVSFTWIGKR